MSTASIIMPNDLSDLCRVCLVLPEKSQYLDMTTIYDEDDDLTYGECFTICTQIDLNADDNTPHQLCKSCGLELQMAYDFYKKVEESKRVLLEYEKQMGEEENLLKPLIREGNENDEIEEQQETNEQQQQPSTPASFMIGNDEAYENLPQSEAILPPHEKNDEEYLTNLNTVVETVEEPSVSFMSTVKNDYRRQHVVDANVDETTTEHHVEPMETEEHLEVDDFQNIETLEDEETETLQIKCVSKMLPKMTPKPQKQQMTKCEIKEIQGEDEEYDDGGIYYEITEDPEEEEQVEEIISSQTNSQELETVDLDDDDVNDNEQDNNDEVSKWQENVVAVANKEHLPVETEEGEDTGEITDADKDFVVITDTDIERGVGDFLFVECPPKRKQKVNTENSNNVKRKRHVGSYSCNVCFKEYPNYSRMMAHRRCHEEDRPKYACCYCSRIYATKQAMDYHTQTAHERTGYSCDICGKVYAVRKTLEIHVRYHTGDFPYVCDECGKKFAQAGHLTTHKNVKHKNVRYSCEYPDCGKFFTSSNSLRNHEFVHGAMPFECEYCKLGYPAKAKLKIHIKRKHGLDMTTDELECMRKFHVMRSKLNLVKVAEIEEETET